MTIRSQNSRLNKLESAISPPVKQLVHWCSSAADKNISDEQIVADHLAKHPEDQGKQYKVLSVSWAWGDDTGS